MELEFYGGASEFGPNSMELRSGGKSWLFEYGMIVEDMSTPRHKGWDFVKNLESVFITHAHIDHMGALPMLAKHGYRNPVYGTPATLDLMSMMLWDSLKVQKNNGMQPLFLSDDIGNIEDQSRPMVIGQPVGNGLTATAYGAGHIPGSSMLLIEVGGKRILFTGDVKFEETQLMPAAHADLKNIDVVICESTYWNANHPPRKELGDRLREVAKEVVLGGGMLLLPSFAVGRSQELLLTLSDLGLPIWMDGMSVEATRRALLHPEGVKDYGKLAKAFAKAYKMKKGADRRLALKEPGIVIATAGMLSGGPMDFYIRKLHKQENCRLILNGFQVPGTPGQVLRDTGVYSHEGFQVKPKFPIQFMDFSAHCGRDGMLDFLGKVNPAKVMPMHSSGAPDFAKDLQSMGFESCAPKVGEPVSV